MRNPNWIGKPEKNYVKPLDGQLELETVIDHMQEPGIRRTSEDTHKPAGIRLAKMLARYEARPSSFLCLDSLQIDDHV